MKTITLKVVSEKIDIKKNTITYETDANAGPGIIVLTDESGEHGMIITNQVHNGGTVVLKMKPFVTPARKYNIGDVVGTLVLFG